MKMPFPSEAIPLFFNLRSNYRVPGPHYFSITDEIETFKRIYEAIIFFQCIEYIQRNRLFANGSILFDRMDQGLRFGGHLKKSDSNETQWFRTSYFAHNVSAPGNLF